MKLVWTYWWKRSWNLETIKALVRYDKNKLLDLYVHQSVGLRLRGFFCAQCSNCWYDHDSQCCSVFSTAGLHSLTSSRFHNRKRTHSRSFFIFPPSLYVSLSFSLSHLNTDTNIPKCGLTASATTDFLFTVFHRTACCSVTQNNFLKNMTFLRLMLPRASMPLKIRPFVFDLKVKHVNSFHLLHEHRHQVLRGNFDLL